MIIFKNLDPNKIKIDEKSYNGILIWRVGWVTIKSHLEIKSVNPFHLIVNKMNGYIEENNGDKDFTLVPTDESNDTLKKYEEL